MGILGRESLIRKISVASLLITLAAILNSACSVPLSSGDKIVDLTLEEQDRLEFRKFCELGFAVRSHRSYLQETFRVSECAVTLPYQFDIREDGKMLFTLIMIVTWGAAVRALIRKFDLKIPYTVVLMLSGLVIGIISKYFCETLYTYTAIARIDPTIILYTFLPVLIFQSAFAIPVHTFMKSVGQIIVISFPGMVMCISFIAMLSMTYFTNYHWNLLHSCLFGSIISITDSDGVVSILKELGVSEVLGVLIEGESLLSDGFAIILIDLFQKLLNQEHEGRSNSTALNILLFILQHFLLAVVGGPIFGWLMAKFTIYLLSFVFNDSPVECSTTVVSAYITYWMSEAVLGVSGVMAVVVLGLTLSAERTVISPESVGPVHHFWEILGYLANTVLFVLVGIVISETALKSIEIQDWLNLLLLYITIHVSRFIMLIFLYPLLTRTGYGMTWQNIIIMLWGGLRGGLGIFLPLQVFRSENFCNNPLMGAKILFQAAGIVVMTLVINGTTMKTLLGLLGFTKVTEGRKKEMRTAVRRIQRIRLRWTRIYQLLPEIFDANWTLVQHYCLVKNPYAVPKKIEQEEVESKSDTIHIHPPKPVRDNTTVCWKCDTLIINEPTTEQYLEMTEDAIFRVLKAIKSYYFTMFELGLVSDVSVQILLTDIEQVCDQDLTLIKAESFDKYMKDFHGFYPWLKNKLVNFEKAKQEEKLQKPSLRIRHVFFWIITQEWFEAVRICIIVFNAIPILWDMIKPTDDCTSVKHKLFMQLNYLFTFLYTLEFLIEILGRTAQDYFCEVWNYIDTLALVVSYVDCIISSFETCEASQLAKTYTIRRLNNMLRLVRLIRFLRLLKPILPKIIQRLNLKIDTKLFQGYDISRGFAHAIDEVLKLLPQMIENRMVLKTIKEYLETERSKCIRNMAEFQHKYPGIAIAVKTRQACRTCLNAMQDSLRELKDKGLVDDEEENIITRFVEIQMKRLWHSPHSINPYSVHALLTNLPWLNSENEELYNLIVEATVLRTFDSGDTMCERGDPPSGIFIVAAGMVKVSYFPTHEIVQLRNEFGKIPISELYCDLTFNKDNQDYFSTGFIIGEAACLTGEPRAAQVMAETSIVSYHIPRATILEAIRTFANKEDPLEGQIWRSIGMQRAKGLLASIPEYSNMPLTNLNMHLKLSCVPIGEQNVFNIPYYISEVCVIEGYAKNIATNEVYVAPYLVPKRCRRLVFFENPMTVNRILIIAKEKDYDFSHVDKFSNHKNRFENVGHSIISLVRRRSKNNKLGGESESD